MEGRLKHPKICSYQCVNDYNGKLYEFIYTSFQVIKEQLMKKK